MWTAWSLYCNNRSSHPVICVRSTGISDADKKNNRCVRCYGVKLKKETISLWFYFKCLHSSKLILSSPSHQSFQFQCAQTFFGCSSSGDPFVVFCRYNGTKVLQDAVILNIEALKIINLQIVHIWKKYSTLTAVTGAAAVRIKTQISHTVYYKNTEEYDLSNHKKLNLTCGVNTRLWKKQFY